MGKYLPASDDNSPGGEPVLEQFESIGGKYQCQTCDEMVKGAYYDRENWTVRWKCTDGHLSQIKEFVV